MPVGFSRVMGTGVMGEGNVLILLNVDSFKCHVGYMSHMLVLIV